MQLSNSERISVEMVADATSQPGQPQSNPGHPLTKLSDALTSDNRLFTTGGKLPVEAHSQPEVKLFSFAGELAEPLKHVVWTAYASRGKLARDVKSYVCVSTNAIASMPGRFFKVVHNPKIHALLNEEEDPEALAAVVTGASAALCLGVMGAILGSSAGGAAGVVFGILPAIFTLGLSVPVGLLVGAGSGLCTGFAVGSSIGFVAGAAAGGTFAYFRVEILNTANGVMSRVDYFYDRLVRQPSMKVKSTTKGICDKTKHSVEYTKSCAKALAASRHAQITVASGATGAAALGTVGATGGALAGAATGAAIGFLPALFTFGLSIPVGAVLGGGMGLFLGTAAGASTGFVGGATLGYAGYKGRHQPARAAAFVRKQVGSTKGSQGGGGIADSTGAPLDSSESEKPACLSDQVSDGSTASDPSMPDNAEKLS